MQLKVSSSSNTFDTIVRVTKEEPYKYLGCWLDEEGVSVKQFEKIVNKLKLLKNQLLGKKLLKFHCYPTICL